MLRILSVAAALALVVGPARGQDGQTYTIKLKKAVQGMTKHVETTDESDESLKVTDNTGNALKDEAKKESEQSVYKQTVLEMRAGTDRPTRLKRHYEKATVTSGGETARLPYEGKTVLIEKKGDRFAFRIEGGKELTGADAKALDKEFNDKGELSDAELEHMLMPGRPVKVNESWKINVARLAKAFQQEMKLALDADKSTCTGILKNVYRKDRRQYGVMVLRLDLAPKSVTKDGMTFAFQPGSRMVMEIRYDGCIDGSVMTNTSRFSMEAAVEALLPSPDQPMFRLNAKTKGRATSKTVEQ